MGVLGPLLPESYSPIQRINGSGNQKVYLAEISEEVFISVVAGAAFDAAALEQAGDNRLDFEFVKERVEEVVQRSILEDPSLDNTTKESVIQARRGQGKFRLNVEAIESACRLTGVTSRALLKASHIRPWRLCTSAAERLDGMNGLMLTPDADHLFDRGFITFEDDGDVIVSTRVDPIDLRRLGLEQLTLQRFGVAEAPVIWKTTSFHAAQKRYLACHRKDVFVT